MPIAVVKWQRKQDKCVLLALRGQGAFFFIARSHFMQAMFICIRGDAVFLSQAET